MSTHAVAMSQVPSNSPHVLVRSTSRSCFSMEAAAITRHQNKYHVALLHLSSSLGDSEVVQFLL
jgi:hypothetical protein